MSLPVTNIVDDILREAKKVPPSQAVSGDRPGRQGGFKVSQSWLDMLKDIPEIGDRYEKGLFTKQLDHINKLSRDQLAAMFGVDNIPDAQDVIAKHGKKAFQLWMQNIGKIDAKLGSGIRSLPELAPLWFYAIMVRVSGRDMANIVLKKYFSSEPEYSWMAKAKMKTEDVECSSNHLSMDIDEGLSYMLNDVTKALRGFLAAINDGDSRDTIKYLSMLISDIGDISFPVYTHNRYHQEFASVAQKVAGYSKFGGITNDGWIKIRMAAQDLQREFRLASKGKTHSKVAHYLVMMLYSISDMLDGIHQGLGKSLEYPTSSLSMIADTLSKQEESEVTKTSIVNEILGEDIPSPTRGSEIVDEILYEGAPFEIIVTKSGKRDFAIYRWAGSLSKTFGGIAIHATHSIHQVPDMIVLAVSNATGVGARDLTRSEVKELISILDKGGDALVRYDIRSDQFGIVRVGYSESEDVQEGVIIPYRGKAGTMGFGPTLEWPGRILDFILVDKKNRDVHGESSIVQYQGGEDLAGLFITFDASEWHDSEEKKPVKYEIEALGQKKKGTIRSIAHGDLVKAINDAKKFARDTLKKVINTLPKFPGWSHSYDDYGDELTYEKTIGMSGELAVTFFNFAETVATGNTEQARIWFRVDENTEDKDVTYKGMSDISKIIKQAEQLGAKWYKPYAAEDKKGNDSLEERTIEWETTIIGNDARMRAAKWPNEHLVIEELPGKPVKKKVRRTELSTGWMTHSAKLNTFMISNLLRDAKINKNMNYDKMIKAMKNALEIAKRDTQKKDKDTYSDDWFKRVGYDGLMQEDTVSYLEVEPADYKPVVIAGKDFSVSSQWDKFNAYSPDSDFNQSDPHYTSYDSTSKGSARKFYKLVKADPDILKSVPWMKFGDWLQKNKIGYDINFSVWH